MSSHSRKIISGLLIALLTACGGGGADTSGNNLALAPSSDQLPATDTGGRQYPTPTQPTASETPSQTPVEADTPPFVFDDTARFNGLGSIVADAAGNVYVNDSNNQAIRKIATTGDVSTLPTSLTWPSGLAIDTEGNLYTNEGQVIRKIAPDGSKTELAALPPNWRLWTVDSAGNLHVLIDDSSGYGTIYRVTPEGQMTVPITGEYVRPQSSISIAADAAGNLYVGLFRGRIFKVVPDGTATVYVDTAGDVNDMTFDAAGNLYVSYGVYSRPSPGYCMSYPEDCVIKIQESGIVKVAPDGTMAAEMAYFNQGGEATADRMGVAQITIGSAGYPGGSYVYAAFGKRHAVYKITPSNELRHIAGAPGEPGYSD